MSYIGKPAREQHSGRVLLAEYSITSSIQQIVIQQPFVNEGALYRQHEIEFISMLSNSNNNLAFQMHRDSDRQEDATFSNASDRQEFTGAMRECRLRASGSNDNEEYNATVSGSCVGSQHEVDGGGATPDKKWIEIFRYVPYQNHYTLSGKITLYNLTYNDDVTRWVTQTFGQEWLGNLANSGNKGSWAMGNTKYTDRMMRVAVTPTNNWTSGRIRVWGMAKGGGATTKDGSSPERAASSASELYKNGVSREGTYWLNNLYTGHVPRLAYCKFNMNHTTVGSNTQGSPRGGYGTNRNFGTNDDGSKQGESMTYHMQKWTPVHMRGYNYNGQYSAGGGTGTCTVSDGSEIESLMTGQQGGAASNHTIYKTSGTSTNSGNKATMRLGITHRQISTHTWFSHRYMKQMGSGGTAWDMDWALEREHYSSQPSSPPGPTGNFGNNYNGGQQVILGEYANNATIPAGANGWSHGVFSHRMTRARFANESYTRIGTDAPSSGGNTMGTSSVIGAHPTDPSSGWDNDIWDSVKAWDTLQPGAQGSYWSNTGQGGYGGWNASYWIGLSIKSRTQNNTEAQAYFEFWVHIP